MKSRNNWRLMWESAGFPVLQADINIHTYRDELREIFNGFGYRNFIFVGKENVVRSYYFQPEIGKANIHGLKILSNKGFVKKSLHSAERNCKKFSHFLDDSIIQSNLTQKSNEELARLFQEALKRYRKVYAYFGVTQPQCFELIDQKIRNCFKSKLLKEDLITKHFTLLTTPSRPSFITREEIDWLKIVLEASKNPKVVRLFKSKIGDIEKKLKIEASRLNKLIDSHIEKYAFIMVETGKQLSKVYFLKLLQNNLRVESEVFEKQLWDIKQRPIVIENKREEVLRKLNLPKKIIDLTTAVCDFTWSRENVRLAWMKGRFVFKKLYQKIARRLHLSQQEVEACLEEEIINFLRGKETPTREILKDRMEYYLYQMKGGALKIWCGKKAKQIEREEIGELVSEAIKEIKGNCANPGMARGRVKVFSWRSKDLQKDIREMKGGEILVAGMTRPQLIGACRKAVAIVTDEGGITCHAAIVSRELGIPCIVGTKIATQVLKDGDMVEVDADKGIVKILK